MAVIFQFFLFKDRGMNIKIFAILILVSLIFCISSNTIYSQNEYNIPSKHISFHPPTSSINVTEKSIVDVSYRVYVDGYSDTVVRYKLEVFNPDGKKVHTQSVTTFANVNEHVGGAELHDSTTFYCDKPGEYTLQFTTNQSESGFGDPGVPGVDASGVPFYYGVTSLVFGIFSVVLLVLIILLNAGMYLKMKKRIRWE